MKRTHKGASASATHALKPIRNLTPVNRWEGSAGINFAFEDTEEAIRISGLVPSWMPYPGAGVRSCVRREEPYFVKISRLNGNRLRLWISADSLTASDREFRNFLGSLLTDTRLSLVKGEPEIPPSNQTQRPENQDNVDCPVNQDAVDGLRKLLKQAEAGKVVGYAMVVSYSGSDGYLANVIGELEDHPTYALGAIAILQEYALKKVKRS